MSSTLSASRCADSAIFACTAAHIMARSGFARGAVPLRHKLSRTCSSHSAVHTQTTQQLCTTQQTALLAQASNGTLQQLHDIAAARTTWQAFLQKERLLAQHSSCSHHLPRYLPDYLLGALAAFTPARGLSLGDLPQDVWRKTNFNVPVVLCLLQSSSVSQAARCLTCNTADRAAQ